MLEKTNKHTISSFWTFLFLKPGNNLTGTFILDLQSGLTWIHTLFITEVTMRVSWWTKQIVISILSFGSACVFRVQNRMLDNTTELFHRGDFAQETMHTTTRAGKVNYLWPVPHFGLWSLPDHMTWQTCVWPESPWSLLPIQRLYNTEKGDLRNSTVLAEGLLCSVKV